VGPPATHTHTHTQPLEQSSSPSTVQEAHLVIGQLGVDLGRHGHARARRTREPKHPVAAAWRGVCMHRIGTHTLSHGMRPPGTLLTGVCRSTTHAAGPSSTQPKLNKAIQTETKDSKFNITRCSPLHRGPGPRWPQQYANTAMQRYTKIPSSVHFCSPLHRGSGPRRQQPLHPVAALDLALAAVRRLRTQGRGGAGALKIYNPKTL
jgi:hypothetical protein